MHMSSSSTLTNNCDNEKTADNKSISFTVKATTTAKECTTFPKFLIKAVAENKSHQRYLKGEKVLEKLLKMTKVARYVNTFKYMVKGEWVTQVFETVF